jgi:hypothetical protein
MLNFAPSQEEEHPEEAEPEQQPPNPVIFIIVLILYHLGGVMSNELENCSQRTSEKFPKPTEELYNILYAT